MRIRALHRLLLVLLCASQAACAVAKLGRVTLDGSEVARVDGSQVRVLRQGVETQTKGEMSLKKGDVIETGSGATAVIRFRGDARAVMMPGARIEIRNPGIITWLGEVFLSGVFRSETELNDYATESTRFALRVERTGSEVLSVVSGRVRVSSRSSRFSPLVVGPGYQLEVRQGVARRPRRMSRDELHDLLLRVNAAEEPSRRVVPPLQGLVEQEALRRLAEHQLRMGIRKAVPAPPNDVGRVVGQKPKPGERALRRGNVDLLIGVEVIRVPDLHRRSGPEAEQILRSSRLRLGRVNAKITGSVAEGQVVEQRPPPNAEVLAGNQVDIWIEAPSVVVPPLTGQARGQAEARLAQAGLRVGAVRSELRPGVADGTILSQSRRAGERVPPNTAVDLIVAQRGVYVPNVVNLPQHQALQQIGQAGLGWQVTTEQTAAVPEGHVIRTSPGVGNLVPAGIGVRVFVAVPPPFMVVPPLTGQARGQAEVQLAQAGLRVGAVRGELRAGVADGTILSQSRRAGERVPPNTAVDLIVAQRGVYVPNVVNLPQHQALQQISQAGLGWQVTTEQTAAVPEGRVIRTSPGGGNLVPAGTGVRVFVAAVPPPLVAPPLMVPPRGQPPPAAVPPPFMVVPPLTGQARGQAEARLAQAGLRVGAVRSELRVGVADGTILSQSRRAGERVPPNTAVDLIVAQRGVYVPNVVNWPKGQAVQRIQQVGLRPRVTYTHVNVPVAVGHVIATRPDYRNRNLVRAGSEVEVIVQQAYIR